MELIKIVKELEKADTKLFELGYIDKLERRAMLQMAVTLKAAESTKKGESCI